MLVNRKAVVSLCLTVLVALAGFTAFTFLRENHQKACVEDRTIAALHDIIIDNMFKDEDGNLKAKIPELVTFNMITFQHYNNENGRIDCRGVITLKAAGYPGYEEQSGSFDFFRHPQANGDRFLFEVAQWEQDTSRKLVAWLDLIKPPKLPNNIKKISTWTVVDGKPTKLGDCALTKISAKKTRLQSNIGGVLIDVPASGSAVEFENGIYQVSYDTVGVIESSQVGDPIKLCLIEIPENCPASDDRGKIYSAMNVRTDSSWFLPDSEHMCGGQ